MVHRFKIFHVVGIDIEDHRNVRMEFQEMVLKFAGFADHHLAAAQSAAAADRLELAADDRRRVHPALDKHLVSIAVVVVLPWVPQTPTQLLNQLVTSPSSSARLMVGTPLALAAISSGFHP